MRAIIKGAGAVVGVGVAGWIGAVSMQDDTVRDEATGQIEEAGDLGAFRIRVGDCFNDLDPDALLVESVTGVPCDTSHDNEAYAAFDLAEGAYPPELQVIDSAEAGCWERFESVFQESYADSQLWFSFLYPSQESWEEIDDREVLCYVFLPETPVAGSLVEARTASVDATDS